MSDLFRKEVLDKQGQKLFGDVVLASPIGHVAMAALLAFIMCGLVVFAIVGEFSRKERVFGFLTPDKGLIRVSPRQAGLIEDVHIEIGEHVTQGEKLFTIKLDTVSGYGESTASSLLAQLKYEKTELELTRDVIPKEFNLLRSRLRGQINAALSDGLRLEERIIFQSKIVENEHDTYKRYKNLFQQGAAAPLEMSRQETRLLQAQQALETLRNEKQKVLDLAADLEQQYSLVPISEQKASSDLSSRLSAVEQRITQTQGQERNTITAPVSGRIASLTVKEGQIANVQKAMATILPKGGKLNAELLVPSRAAGFVKKGQTVRLLYDAFPYQKFGFHSGVITEVSRTVINPSDLSITSNTQEAIFIITVNLNEQAIEVNDEIYDLQSGMTLSADIILEDRKIWEWILEPILGSAKY